MRPTSRLLAKYLEAGTPTGLTGLWTHATPRSALIYLYGQTLSRLEAIPATSVYRQSVEATTRHRLGLVAKMVPAGYDKWAAEVEKLKKAYPEPFEKAVALKYGGDARIVKFGGQEFVVGVARDQPDERALNSEWDGATGMDMDDSLREAVAKVDESDMDVSSKGELSAEEHAARLAKQAAEKAKEEEEIANKAEDMAKFEAEGKGILQAEPQLTADQIKELETQIGAGLIEEVIQVAEGELGLIDTMEKSKPWEDLEEKPAPGQWEYFERTSM